MSLSGFLTEFQALHPSLSCLSGPLTQPGTVWWFPVPSYPPPLASRVPSSPCHVPSDPQTFVEPYLPPGILRPGSFVLDDFRRYSVDLHYTVFQTTGSVPISTVIINKASGSRTILHAYRFVPLSVPCQPPPPSLTPRTGPFFSRRPRAPPPLPLPARGPGPL